MRNVIQRKGFTSESRINARKGRASDNTGTRSAKREGIDV